MANDNLPVTFSERPWIDPYRVEVPFGERVDAIVARLVPERLRGFAEVEINGTLIPREAWGRVRPKRGAVICISIVPRGQGGLRLGLQVVAMVIAMVVSIYFTPYAGMAVGLALNLAIDYFVPPPMPELSKGRGDESPNYAISGSSNTARQWSPVPLVLGKFKIVPAYGAQPIREIIGGNDGNIYWRALFILGHGPLYISDMRIGDTPISSYSEVEIEIRRGWHSNQISDQGVWDSLAGGFPLATAVGQTWTASDSATVLGLVLTNGDTITYNGFWDNQNPYAWDVNQTRPFKLWPDGSIETNADVTFDVGVPVTRRSAPAPDELSVDFVFPYGLYKVEKHPPGKVSGHKGTVSIRYAPAGTSDWISIAPITVSGNTTQALYWGHRWTVDPGLAPDGYDVEITTRFIPDGSQLTSQWAILRTTRTGKGWYMQGITSIAMRILASGQLNGQLNNFSAVCQTVALDWDGSTWGIRPTSNPAALYRYVLQHPLNPRAVPDAQIDITALENWAEYIIPRGWWFNGVIDTETTLGETMRTICRVGRATPSIKDGKRSVTIDRPPTESTPTQMFTPANCRQFKLERGYESQLHGYRTAYIHADKDYAPDEIVAYADGYSADNATLLERLEWVGIDNPGQSWSEGRYHLAQRIERPESYSFITDIEGLHCRRGDWVQIQHDVIAVGIAAVRIAEIEIVSGKVTAVLFSRPVRVEPGKTYGMRLRRVVDGKTSVTLHALSAPTGDQSLFDLVVDVPVETGPRVEDLVAYGEFGREVLDAVIRDLRPRRDLSVEITAIPLALGVHTAGMGEIPPFDPVATRVTAWPIPFVTEVVSDTSVATITPSRGLLSHVLFRFADPGIGGFVVVVAYRPTGTNQAWAAAKLESTSPTEALISGPVEGTYYDFRIWYQGDPYFVSSPAFVNNYYVIGRVSPPAALIGLQVTSVGGLALLRWEPISELDVRYGGYIEFRHVAKTSGAAWESSLSIGNVVAGDQAYAFVPLKPGTYFGRVFDSGGRSSPVVTVTTEQLSVLTYSPVAELVEDPGFYGTKDKMIVSDGILYLEANATIDDIDNWDDIENIDLIGTGTVELGIYDFGLPMNVGAYTVRLTSHVVAAMVNESESFDARPGNVDSWADWDGSSSSWAPADAVVYVSTSTDGASWSAWKRCDAEEFVGPWIRGRLIVQTFDASWTVAIEELRLKAERI